VNPLPEQGNTVNEEIINKYQETIENHLTVVKKDIAAACKAAGRDPSEVHIVAVSKFHSAAEVCAAQACGLTHFGENRVQELLPKQDAVAAADCDVSWHLIGTLQRNKVRQVIGKVALIHSVDSLRLLKEINKRAANEGIVQPILFQVNLSGVDNKHGLSVPELIDILSNQISEFPHVQVKGLMTMAEFDWDDDQLDRFFAEFKKTFDLAKTSLPESMREVFSIISAGMSQDFVQAIRHGATHVRIGTAIFGPRHYK
jgi:pyridoxal phosphate enzyme (YggS family)